MCDNLQNGAFYRMREHMVRMRGTYIHVVHTCMYVYGNTLKLCNESHAPSSSLSTPHASLVLSHQMRQHSEMHSLAKGRDPSTWTTQRAKEPRTTSQNVRVLVLAVSASTSKMPVSSAEVRCIYSYSQCALIMYTCMWVDATYMYMKAHGPCSLAIFALTKNDLGTRLIRLCAHMYTQQVQDS